MFNIKRILLPTDFSKISLSAAPYALSLAEKYGASIHLLHVLEKTPPILAIRSLDLSEDKIIRSMEEDAQKSLNETVTDLKAKSSVPITGHLKKGIDFEEINSVCADNTIDVIVIATNGRSGFMHKFLGSVAEKVIRSAKCPVMVITPSDV
jgi:universal stress protein A